MVELIFRHSISSGVLMTRASLIAGHALTVRALVLDRADANDIEKAARAEGMERMREDGLRQVLAGVTTVEEVLRVTQES